MNYFYSILMLAFLTESAVLVEEITEKLQKEFTKKYNDVRSRYARGEVPGFPSVTNMMEASWSREAAQLAEDIVNQYCKSGNYSVLENKYHFSVSLGESQNDTVEVWADAFYRYPERNTNKSIQETIRPEVTEVGCSVGICRNVSYAVCAYGKIKCSGDCIVYDNGTACSKCPSGSKCTLDGLCSLRENATYAISRIPLEQQMSFVRYLNIFRTKISFGLQWFDYNANSTQEHVNFPSAAKMMEVKWSDSAAKIAESAMADYCKNGTSYYNKGKYKLIAKHSYAKYYKVFKYDSMISLLFSISNVAFPLFLTPEYIKSELYSEFFSWKRRQILSTMDSVTEIGCSIEYCRGDGVVICALGAITCTSNCTVYKKGKICSKCPVGSKCTFDGLCSFRTDASTNFTKLSDKVKDRIIDTINDSRSIIANGKYEISINLEGIEENRTLATATNMMEIEWHNYSVMVAELRITEWCKYAGGWAQLTDKLAAWSFPVSLENSSRNNSYWNIDYDYYFRPSIYEWPLVMTSEEFNGGKFEAVFDWNRFDMFISWASISYMGCAMEYCRGEIILMCSMGSFGDCLRKCRVYQNGTVCSNCPENTICAENGLCRKDFASTTMNPRLAEDQQHIEQFFQRNGATNYDFELLIVILFINLVFR